MVKYKDFPTTEKSYLDTSDDINFIFIVQGKDIKIFMLATCTTFALLIKLKQLHVTKRHWFTIETPLDLPGNLFTSSAIFEKWSEGENFVSLCIHCMSYSYLLCTIKYCMIDHLEHVMLNNLLI